MQTVESKLETTEASQSLKKTKLELQIPDPVNAYAELEKLYAKGEETEVEDKESENGSK